MLNLMRKHAKSWMIKVIVGLITCVFVLWGVGSFREKRKSQIAFVNGEPIYYEEFGEVYKKMIDQLQKSFGNALDDAMLKTLQVKRQALNQIIDKKLLLTEANRLNLRVTDGEVARAITQVPAFQRAGVFDGQRYKDILNRFRMSPEQFEMEQKETMVLEKLRSFINSSVKVSDQEALEWHKWGNASVDVNYVLFDPARYQDIKPSAQEIQEYFDKNKETYKTEPQIKVRYLRFAFENYRAEAIPTEAEIKDYYEANPAEFKTPKMVEASHILIKAAADADAETVETARQKSLDILKKAQAGEDFAELAKTYSEGPSGAEGGLLGAFKKEDMVKPFADKAFTMQAGEISEPVRTQFGWHIIKVGKINPVSQLTYPQALPKILDKLTAQGAKYKAYDEAEQIYELTFEGDDLNLVAQERKLDIQTTDFFARQGPAKGVKDPAQFASTAFKLLEGDISDIQDLGDGYYIIQLIEKIEAQIPELETVKAAVQTDVVAQKQDQQAQADAKSFAANLKAAGALAEESRKIGLEPGSTGFFKRNASIPDIGYETQLLKAAFELNPTNKFSAEGIKGEKGYYVLGFKARQEPDFKSFENDKDKIKKNLLEQKKYKTFNTWLSMLKGRSEIQIEENFIN